MAPPVDAFADMPIEAAVGGRGRTGHGLRLFHVCGCVRAVVVVEEVAVVVGDLPEPRGVGVGVAAGSYVCGAM